MRHYFGLTNMRIIIAAVIAVNVCALKFSWTRNLLAKAAATAVATIGFCGPTFGIELSDQLKDLQYMQSNIEKSRIQTEEAELTSRELQYPPEKLVARGVLRLMPENVQASAYPFGVSEAYFLDPSFASDDSSMYILAVGREGPPLAAKKYSLKNTKFPLVFEITSDDLLFPYTPSAWLASSNHADTIAISTILSVDGKLSTSDAADRLGFGLSEPTTIAGVPGRTSAPIDIKAKIDVSLYTPAEIDILRGIDENVDQIIQSSAKLIQNR